MPLDARSAFKAKAICCSTVPTWRPQSERMIDRKADGDWALNAPVELRQAADGLQLVVGWPDGTQTTLSARTLRAACRCAHCSAHHLHGEPEIIPELIRITTLAPIGDYAVHIAFSDGHARGIFPWAMLRALGETPPRN